MILTGEDAFRRHKYERRVEQCKAKKKFATEGTAILFAGGVVKNRRNNKAKPLVTAYRCPICSFWHLTTNVWRGPGKRR